MFVIGSPVWADPASFVAEEADYDREKGLWVVRCSFERGGVVKRARLEIDNQGLVKGYRLLQ